MQKIVITYTAVGLLILLLLLAFSNEIQAADESFFVKLDKENCITKLNVTTKQTQIIYHSDKWRTHNITVSPNNRYIAFTERTKPVWKIVKGGYGDGYAVPPNYCLVILDSSGKLIDSINMDVMRYVWSPDGEKIAFLTFKPYPDYKYRRPTGAWVYDMNTSKIIKIKDKAREINWAVFDSAVYLYSRDRDGEQVVRWDPVSQRLDSTVYKDIYFSPDGKYYLRLWKEEYKPIKLYETSTNKLLFDIRVYEHTEKPFPEDIGELWNSHDKILLYGHGWVFNSGHFLLFSKADVIKEIEGEGVIKLIKSIEVKNVINSIYDPQQRKVLKTFEGNIPPWVSNGYEIPVERNGQIVFEGIP